jgi:hypothetical protein
MLYKGQGGIISGFVKKYCNNVTSCRLQIDFGNPGAAGVRFCDAYTDPGSLCINDVDPQIYQGDMPAENFVARKRSVAEVHHGRAIFFLASGMEVNMRKSLCHYEFGVSKLRALNGISHDSFWDANCGSVVGRGRLCLVLLI